MEKEKVMKSPILCTTQNKEEWPSPLPVNTSHFFGADGHILPLKEMERKHIEIALRKYPNRSEAARRLQIGRSTVYRKAQEFGLE